MGEIFERTIPGLPLGWTGERLTSEVYGQIEVEHLHRYFLARDMCRNLDVLDIACGEGYGSALLAQVARSVVGIDVSDQAVAHAERAYPKSNLSYQQGDARSLPFPDDSLDVIVSFETLEHFYEHDQFLAEVRRVLRPTGRLIISSPDRDVYSPPGSAANPYHVRELSRIEFEALLHSFFPHALFLSQRPMLGSALIADDNGGPSRTLTFEKRGERFYEASSGLPRSLYIIAIASKYPVENVPNSLFVETDQIQDALSLLRMETQKRQSPPQPSVEELLPRLEAAENQQTLLADEREQILQNIQAYEHNAQQAVDVIKTLNQRVAAAESEVSSLQDQCLTVESQRSLLADERERLLQEIQAYEYNAQQTVGITQVLNQRLETAENIISTLQDQRAILQRNLRQNCEKANYNYAMGIRIAELERECAEWQAKYFALRNRLIAILKRYGILHFSRLVPRKLRSIVRERLLGGPKL